MENSPEAQSNKWLIIFLIYADFTTSEKLPMIEKMKVMVNSMLGDIITTPIDNSQTRMFVIMNSIKYIFNDDETKVDDRTAFYTIKGNKEGTRNHISDCELVDNNGYYEKDANGTLVLQKSEQLASVLEKTNVQADEEVFLITWDHGSGFGIFRKEVATLGRNAVRHEIDKNLFQYPFIKQFWAAIRKKDEKGFLKNKPVDNAYTTIQTGHNLMKIRNTPQNEKRLQHYLNKGKAFVYNDKIGRIRVLNLDEDALAMTIASKGSLFRRKSTPVLSDGLLQSEIQTESKPAEILTNKELNESLKNWQQTWPAGKVKKVGVLLMSNCWMMNLHTMYALKDTVRCLVAPQGNIDVPGYNLKDIFNEIGATANAKLEPTELAKICVETIDNEYSKAKAIMLDKSEPGVLDLFKIFAVDLSDENILKNQIDLLKTLIKTILDQLNESFANETEIKYFLKYIRSACFDFSEGVVMMVDIVNWVISINSADRQFKGPYQKLTSDFQDIIASFEQAFLKNNDAIIKFSNGDNVYSPKNPKADFATIVLPPTGYSIFFPIEDCKISLHKDTYINVKDNVLSDMLLEDLPNWRKFLNILDPNIDNIFVP